MPLGYGSSATFTTADPTGSRQYTRHRGALILGAETKSDMVAIATAGASVNPPHIINVSTMKATMTMSGGTGLETSTATTVYGYTAVAVSTYSLSSSGGTSSGPAPTFLQAFTGAMVYDMITSRLCIYSTSVGEWRSIALSSS